MEQDAVQTELVAAAPPEQEESTGLKKVGVTERGTPVYLIEEDIPESVLPKSCRRARGSANPAPHGPFSEWLSSRIGRGNCAIVRIGRSTRIYKIGKEGDVFTITARSIAIEDRKRLVADGILK